MGTDELQMVMDTLKSLGEDGKAAFIWWLVFDKAIPAFVGIVALCVFGYVATHFSRVFNCYSYMCTVRDRLNIGSSGTMYSSEYTQVVQAIDKLITEQKR